MAMHAWDCLLLPATQVPQRLQLVLVLLVPPPLAVPLPWATLMVVVASGAWLAETQAP